MLIYAVGGEHPLRHPSQRLIAAIRTTRVTATTTVEVIQEFAYARARRYGRTDAVERAREYADLLSPLLMVEIENLGAGLTLFERHPRLGAFDAVLAAVALATRADGLVSADAGFSGIEGLRHIRPGTEDLEELLRQ